jgi:hypothetical protein
LTELWLTEEFQIAAATILDFLHFHFRFSFFWISRYVKYILAKFRENRVDSNELAAQYVKFKMAAAAILVLD